MTCKACKREHSPMLTCGRALRMAKIAEPVSTTPETVSTIPAKKSRATDRHKPNYQRDLMRKRRAAAKAKL